MHHSSSLFQANGHADRIENVKPMFVEPRGKGTFTEVTATGISHVIIVHSV